MPRKSLGSMFTIASTSLGIASADIEDYNTRVWISKALAEIEYELRLRDPEIDRINAILNPMPGLIEPLKSGRKTGLLEKVIQRLKADGSMQRL